MEPLERIRDRIDARFGSGAATLVPNPSPSGQHSLLLRSEQAAAIAAFLRDDAELCLDYCSNVSGLDWPAAGHLEVVYHLYSMTCRHGPVIIRVRTADRGPGAAAPSLALVWRSAELQEREVFDLFGITFWGHPDLRRLLMWDDYAEYPLRKDFGKGAA